MPETPANPLFQPLQAGAIPLANRILMAPMTRSRATPDAAATPLMARYYAQRASAGLIISEAIAPSAIGRGYLGIPGLYTAEHAASWRPVIEAVHAAGSRIVAQIMHTGRISHPDLLPGGATPVAPSAIAAKGTTFTPTGPQPFVTPRALETAEIPGIIAEYAEATRLALAAGFDGVELHAASGYLPMQFLTSSTNQRTDAYGGSAGNRARFILEALAAMIAIAGADRVGIKLSPELPFNDLSDATPEDTYATLVRAIAPLGLAYLHVVPSGAVDWHALLRPLFPGRYFAGGGLTAETAAALLREGTADAAVYGALFLANPDLPARFAAGAALNVPDPKTFYGGDEHGYLDYPALA